MRNLTDQQMQLACLLHIFEECLKNLLASFVKAKPLKNNDKKYITSSTASSALADVLDSRPDSTLYAMYTELAMSSFRGVIFEAVNAAGKQPLPKSV